jgi:aldose 1-epimerase
MNSVTNRSLCLVAITVLGGCASVGGLDKSKMNITKNSFGVTKTGQPVEMYTLTNAREHVVKVATYGGTIVNLLVPDKSGKIEDVVFGFDSLRDYEERSPFFGCLTGRYANRIAKGKFTLDGRMYSLAVNNGPNHLHGGKVGFDKKVWKAAPVQTGSSVGLILTHTSPDGDEGYPGELACEVIYTWDNDDELTLDYRATTTKPTVVNLTNHSYFNLAGHASGSVLAHQLTLDADSFTPTDATSIPTGEIRAVENTPFDFRTVHPIGERIDAADQQLKFGSGYDHNFVVNGSAGHLRRCAELFDPKTGRVMTVHTSAPGVQLYTAKFMDALKAKGGAVYGRRGAVCLETQHFPDSPNQPAFPSTVVRPGETYRSTTTFKFSVR